MTRKPFQPGRGYTRQDWEDIDMPEATDAELAEAKPFTEAFPELTEAIRSVGRPLSANPKVAVSIRLDRDVVAAFKKDGPGWQSRMNAALREAARLRS